MTKPFTDTEYIILQDALDALIFDIDHEHYRDHEGIYTVQDIQNVIRKILKESRDYSDINSQVL